MDELTSTQRELPQPLQMNRRQFLRHSILAGSLAVAGSTLLAACWPFGDDSEDDDDAEELTPTPEAEEDPTPEPTPAPQLVATPTPSATATPEPSPTPEQAPEDPIPGGALTIALPADPISLHPRADELMQNWVVMAQIYDALLEVDHQFEPVPVLAESFEIADDGSSYTFSIVEGVLFHNGEELTADDVAYSHQWMSVPENGGARSFYYERVDSIEATDSTTVVFNMRGPDGTIPRRAASTFIVPAEYHEEFGWEGQSLEPIGTGPFLLDSWVRGVSLSLIKFDEYFGGEPLLNQIRFEVIGEPASRRSALENGSVDIAWDLTLDDNLQLDENPDIESVQVQNLDCTHIALNNQHPVLSERNVRLAMQIAIDRMELVDLIYQGAATEATTYLSPALFYWHNDQFQSGQVLTDRAIELLEEAGWQNGNGNVRERNGEPLRFTCVAPDGNDPRADGARAISEMLSAIGVDMQVETAPLSETLQQMREGQLDAAIFNWTYGGWLGEPDGRTTLLTGAFNNFSQFSSIQVDNVLYQGVSETDPESRRSLYRNLQERIADQSPFLFLVFPNGYYHHSSRVQGIPDSVRWGPRMLRKLSGAWIFDPS
jgi:peptide/nickel transport system substrate-binding protein